MKYTEIARELLKHPYVLFLMRTESLKFGIVSPDINDKQTLFKLILAGIKSVRHIDEQGLERILGQIILFEKRNNQNSERLEFLRVTLEQVRTEMKLDPNPVGGDAFVEALFVLLLQRGIEVYFATKKVLPIS